MVSSHWEMDPLLSAPLSVLEEVVLLLLLMIGVPVPWGEGTRIVGVMEMEVGSAEVMAIVEGPLSLPLDLGDLRLLRNKDSRRIAVLVLKTNQLILFWSEMVKPTAFFLQQGIRDTFLMYKILLEQMGMMCG
jgi:hypothetical protein